MDHPRIQSDPKVMMGKPVIRGTRLTVEHILRCLAAGDSIEQSEVLELLSRLVDKSLVVVEEQGGDTRYRLLETASSRARSWSCSHAW